MATKIEILSITPTLVSLAFYYPIASPIAEASDPTRVPAGTRLSAQEVQDLKDGTLFEQVQDISINRLTKPQAKAYIEGLWASRQATALEEYQAVWRDADLVGKAFDGTSWS